MVFKTLRELGIEAAQPREFERKRTYIGYKLFIVTESQSTIQAQVPQTLISAYNTHNNDSTEQWVEPKGCDTVTEAYPVCISCLDYASCEMKPNFKLEEPS